ncbi:MAG: M56 family metallopeptidase [Actinomycetota bacterium]
MTRLALLLGILLLFMAVPSLLRGTEIPARWRVRLGFLALTGMLASSAVLLAAVLLPEVLVASSFQQLWMSCSQAFREILGRPVARAPSLVAGAALAIVLGRFAWAFALGIRESRRARIRWGEPRWRLAGGEPVYVLPVDRPEAYSVGSLRGHVVVSRGLLEALDEDERQAVLLHEQAHLRARHQPMLIVGRAAHAALRPLWPAGAAMALIEQAMEESADEYAADWLGDPAVVASGLSKAALAGLRSPVGALSLGNGPDVPARVRRLLAPPEVPAWVPGACIAGAVLLVVMFALTQAIGGLALVAAGHHLLPIGAAAYCSTR